MPSTSCDETESHALLTVDRGRLQTALIGDAKSDNPRGYGIETIAGLGNILDLAVGKAVVGCVARRIEIEAIQQLAGCGSCQVSFHVSLLV